MRTTGLPHFLAGTNVNEYLVKGANLTDLAVPSYTYSTRPQPLARKVGNFGRCTVHRRLRGTQTVHSSTAPRRKRRISTPRSPTTSTSSLHIHPHTRPWTRPGGESTRDARSSQDELRSWTAVGCMSSATSMSPTGPKCVVEVKGDQIW